ncbi:GEVED domain-containing protein [Myroides odoratus]
MYNYTTKKIGILLGLCILGSGTSQALQAEDYHANTAVKEQTVTIQSQYPFDIDRASLGVEELHQPALFTDLPDYCDVTIGYGVNPITLVQFADLNHSTDIEPNPSEPAKPYEDFTALMAHVQRGETYTLTVKGNTEGEFQHLIHVFIDWNNDHVFDVHTEFYRALLQPSTGQDDVNVTFQIRVPEDAVLGTTRMRIIKDNWFIYEDGDFDACTDPEYGQIEDYSIEISDAGTAHDYCQPEISDVARSLPIYEVTFGGTTKTSGDQTTFEPLYEDFTDLVIPVVKGETYPLEVKGKTDGQDMLLVKVYIDYNHDFTFSEEEASTIGFLSNIGGERGEVSGVIQIPTDALNGATRMRIVSMYHNPETTWIHLENVPCPVDYYLGQVEDYTLDIAAAAVAITGVEVTTENDVPAEITTEHGTLQLLARVLPVEANQAVTWSIVQGADLASIDQAGRLTAIENGIVKVKATAVRDTTKSAEIEVTISIEALRCPPITEIKVEDIGEETASIHLVSTATVFEIEYGPAGFVQGEGTRIAQASSIQQIQGLAAEVTYDVYVRVDADCSTWKKISFTTIKVKEQVIAVDDVQKVYGDLPFQSGQSTSQLPLIYSVVDSSVAVVENDTLVIKGAGETEIRVNQPGNNEYLPAVEARFILYVAQAPLVVKPIDQTKVYDGNAHNTWEVTHQGWVYEEDSSVLTGALQYGGAALQAVQAGTYPIEVRGYEAQNYAIQYQEGTLTITKATLEDIRLEDAVFLYDGNPKSIELTQELPAGVTVTYEGNERIAVGDYVVKAILHGGINYEDKTIEANLKIRQALPSLVFEDASFIYDGETKHLSVVDAPQDLTITYEGNGQTEAGTYTVTAVVDGGNQYESGTLTATLTIEKAELTDISLENQSFGYDGQAKALEVEGTIPNGVQVRYTGNNQVEVGEYPVQAFLDGGNNYRDKELRASLSITKGDLDFLVFEDQTLPYDGTAKSIYISGTLPEGTQVVYTNNGQVERGSYLVEAAIDGGHNYNNLVRTATLTVGQGVITGITLGSRTFVYDGEVKSLRIAGELQQEFTVRYTNNEQTAAGTYAVTATISGGEAYDDLVLTATMTITKAPLADLLFESQTFTYDGTAKYVFVSGTLPEGVMVEHLNNGKIDVGSYEVQAKISGGNNYQNRELTATLKIEKATQSIVFEELATLILAESEDFQLQATTTSGLALAYTVDYSGAQPAAEVSATGWVTLKKVGEITLTVTQAGDRNYHPATPISRVLRIVNNDATIHDIWIGKEQYITPQNEIHHVMSCEDLSKEIAIKITLDEGATIEPGATFALPVPKPGIYKQIVTVVSQNGKVKKDYVIIVEKPFAFDQIAVQKFNNTLLINKNPQTNGGYNLVGFQWFKNGELVSNEQVYSAGAMAILNSKDVYHAIVKTAEGDEIHVCPMEEKAVVASGIKLYPNPVVLGQKTTLEVNVTGMQLKGIPVQVFNLNGQLVHTFTMEGAHTTVYLPQTIPGGMYVAIFELNGKRESIKFAVKK